jgi:hypothetical protein
MGALYAGASFRFLLSNGSNGPVAETASIRDWPDFLYRDIADLTPCYMRRGHVDQSVLGAASVIEAIKQYLDFSTRLKINMGSLYMNSFNADGSREISEYAKERGILLRFEINPYTGVGTVARDRNNPDFKGLRESPRYPGAYVTWSRDDLLAKTAGEHARRAKEYGLSAGFFHCIDTGLYELNYEEWNFRTDEEKKRWGDNRGAADANAINIYYNAFRKEIPDFKFIFVPYPYGPSTVMTSEFPANLGKLGKDLPDEFKELERAKLASWFATLTKSVPEDIFFCYREAPRTMVAKWKKALSRQPSQAYFEFGAGCYRPFFATNPRNAKTFFYKNDIIYMSFGGIMNQLARNLVEEALCAEFAWNTSAPGAGDYESYIDILNDSKGPEVIMKDFIPAACAFLFGEAAGSYAVSLMTGNIYMAYIENPEQFLDELKQRYVLSKEALNEAGTSTAVKRNVRPEEFVNAAGMARQYEAIKKARESMEKVLVEKIPFDNVFGARHFSEYYKYAALWEAYGLAWTRYLTAKEAYEKGNIAAGDKQTADGLAAVGGIDAAVKHALAITAGMPQLYPDFPAYPPEQGRWGHKNYLLSIAAFTKKFNDLSAAKNTMGKMVITDPAALAKLKNRVVTAKRIRNGAIAIDGKLSDPAWATANKINGFVLFDRTEQTKKVLNQTEAYVLYDDENIYIGAVCSFIPNGRITANVKEKGKGFWEGGEGDDDTFEIFLDVGRTGKSFRQFAINPLGTQYDGNSSGTPSKGGWRAAATTENGKWTAEIAIPFKEIGADPKNIGRWGINLGRQQVCPKKLSSIVHFEKDFHDIKNFASLEFK